MHEVPCDNCCLLAVQCGFASYAACADGASHDQSGNCVIVDMPPRYLGFEHWGTVGIALGTLASGLILAALMLRNRD